MQVQGVGQGAHQHCLAQARHAFEKDMTSTDQADQYVTHDGTLSHHDDGDCLLDLCHDVAEFRDGHGWRGRKRGRSGIGHGVSSGPAAWVSRAAGQ